MKFKLLITCEHGGNDIPAAYSTLFREHRKLLASHRGYDPGALDLAQDIANHFKSSMCFSTTSRLLIELNRSLHHPALFSSITKNLAATQKNKIIKQFYMPYRKKVENEIKQMIKKGFQVYHLSIHSFTPILDDKVRTADIGLLYDPQRPPEKDFCRAWKKLLKFVSPDCKVKMNYPYKGTSDGLTTHLRSLYTEDKYLGIELEVNQKFSGKNGNEWDKFKKIILTSLEMILFK